MRGDWEGAESLVRERVCGECAARAEVCEARPPGRCLLFELFPLVAQAILATDGPELEDYRRAVRENVCPVCTEAALDLSCELRQQARCALDLHLAQVVAALREAAGRQANPAPTVR